ncbi:MAG: class I SAM-dependent methyltransferase [Chthoniobacteraceae bacterium]
MLNKLTHRLTRSAGTRLRVYADKAERRLIDLAFAKLGLHHAAGIRTWTTRAQLETLFRLATELPEGARVVELGSYLGASTCYLAAGVAAKNGRVIAIDSWNLDAMPGEPADVFEEFKRNTAGVAHLLKIVRKRTQDLVAEDVEPPVHLAFIDADHSYEATRADADFLAPHIAPDGVIAFHDTTVFAGVGRVIGELLAGGQWCLAGHVDNLTWIRRAKWLPWPLPQVPGTSVPT